MTENEFSYYMETVGEITGGEPETAAVGGSGRDRKT